MVIVVIATPLRWLVKEVLRAKQDLDQTFVPQWPLVLNRSG